MSGREFKLDPLLTPVQVAIFILEHCRQAVGAGATPVPCTLVADPAWVAALDEQEWRLSGVDVHADELSRSAILTRNGEVWETFRQWPRPER